eukprot:403335747
MSRMNTKQNYQSTQVLRHIQKKQTYVQEKGDGQGITLQNSHHESLENASQNSNNSQDKKSEGSQSSAYSQYKQYQRFHSVKITEIDDLFSKEQASFDSQNDSDDSFELNDENVSSQNFNFKTSSFKLKQKLLKKSKCLNLNDYQTENLGQQISTQGCVISISGPCETQAYFMRQYKTLKQAYTLTQNDITANNRQHKNQAFTLIWNINNKKADSIISSTQQRELRKQVSARIGNQIYKNDLDFQDSQNHSSHKKTLGNPSLESQNQGNRKALQHPKLIVATRRNNQISHGPFNSHLMHQQAMKTDLLSQQAINKGIKRFQNKDHFDALRSFSKAFGCYEIDVLTPILKRQNELLFNHLVDCYLCCGLTYLKMDQQFDEVQRLMNLILAIDQTNLEAIFLRFLSQIKTLNYEKCHQDLELLISTMKSKGIKFQIENIHGQLIIYNSDNIAELNENNLLRMSALKKNVSKKSSGLHQIDEDQEYFTAKKIQPVSSNSTNMTDSTVDSKSPMDTQLLQSLPQLKQVISNVQVGNNDQQESDQELEECKSSHSGSTSIISKTTRKTIQSHSMIYIFVTSFALKGFSMKQIMGMLLYLVIAVYLKRAVNKVTKTFKAIFSQEQQQN